MPVPTESAIAVPSEDPKKAKKEDKNEDKDKQEGSSKQTNKDEEEGEELVRMEIEVVTQSNSSTFTSPKRISS